jgi:hypothetical protein
VVVEIIHRRENVDVAEATGLTNGLKQTQTERGASDSSTRQAQSYRIVRQSARTRRRAIGRGRRCRRCRVTGLASLANQLGFGSLELEGIRNRIAGLKRSVSLQRLEIREQRPHW